MAFDRSRYPSLATWRQRDKSLLCPGCHRKGCYKEYVYPDGTPVDPVNHLCGKCDHEQACGYHVTPKEWWQSNPKDLSNHIVAQREERQLKRIEIPAALLTRSMQRYDINVLVTWLRSLPIEDTSKEQLEKSLQLYLIGTTQDGGTIFWQVDENRIIRTGKIIHYGSDGHRLKNEDGSSVGFNWIHAKLSGFYPTDTYQLVQCYFGSHLLPVFPDAEVHVVESEKSALIMSIFGDPDRMLWIACGGKKLFTEARLANLIHEHRLIVVYPDHDGWDEWQQIVAAISYDRIVVSDYVEKNYIEGVDPSNADISDIILRRLNQTPEARLEDMKHRNPAVQTLIDTFDLTIHETQGEGSH